MNSAVREIQDDLLKQVEYFKEIGKPLESKRIEERVEYDLEMMKELGYGRDYTYSHSYDGNFKEQQYLPDALKTAIYYHPTENGEEKTIRERLNHWWKTKKR